MKNENKIYFASFQKRLAANAIDMSSTGMIILLLIMLPTSIRAFVMLLYLYVYFILVPVLMRGQSIGKKLLKIKAVKENSYEDLSIVLIHKREIYKYLLILISLLLQVKFTLFNFHIDLTQYQILTIFSNIIAFSAIIFYIGNIYALIERFDKRGIHDLMAKTIVIDLDYQFDYDTKHDEYEDSFYFKTKK